MEEAFVLRIGVFYDGTWFAYLSDFYATVHPRSARISLEGFHDALRWHVHTETGRPFEECLVPEAHYVRGRIDTPATSFDTALATAGVTRHDLPLPGGAASPAGTPRGRRRGTVTGWQAGQPHGFITDTRGGSWFASRDDLPGNRTTLPTGTPVSFTGSPTPPPGHRYPRAYSIRPE
ncbi:hypothetical protein Q5530_16845 [Saccharothrix sp. BKS2]|uniref:hypothetical protein n=1 Tax=Saccharothrix sp. BKS2 TaxID=3064400 RepID=UPI0039EC45D9